MQFCGRFHSYTVTYDADEDDDDDGNNALRSTFQFNAGSLLKTAQLSISAVTFFEYDYIAKKNSRTYCPHLITLSLELLQAFNI